LTTGTPPVPPSMTSGTSSLPVPKRRKFSGISIVSLQQLSLSSSPSFFEVLQPVFELPRSGCELIVCVR
jgi:hypothetical protein